MSEYYCSRCRFELGYSRELPSVALLESNYQKVKHQKHTVLSTAERLQSIFTDPSTSAIRRDLEEALLHGPMEIDDKGRINFYATSTGITGHRYEWGTLVQSQDMTKVVLSTSAMRSRRVHFGSAPRRVPIVGSQSSRAQRPR